MRWKLLGRNYRLEILTNCSARFALCRFDDELAIHIRHPLVRSHADHPTSTWVASVYIVDQGFTKDVWYRNFFVDTNAAGSDMEISAIQVDVRVRGF